MRFIRENERLTASVNRTIKNRRMVPDGVRLAKQELHRFEEPARVTVSGKRTFEAASAHRGEHVCVLNFASSTHPGGGVASGASAQEEALCRCSTLYPTLDTPEMMNRFYRPHRRYCDSLYNDDIIYSPAVTVFKTDSSDPVRLPEEEWYETDVLTCAAPNLRGLPELDEEHRRGYENIMRHRVRRIFEVAAQENAEVLILGAFGCGAFRNPPDIIARVFREVTEEYRHTFRAIEYAVYCKDFESENFRIFRETFS